MKSSVGGVKGQVLTVLGRLIACAILDCGYGDVGPEVAADTDTWVVKTWFFKFELQELSLDRHCDDILNDPFIVKAYLAPYEIQRHNHLGSPNIIVKVSERGRNS